MSRECQLTGKRKTTGRTLSIRGISKKKKGIGLNRAGVSKREFVPNLQKKRILDPLTGNYVRIKMSTAALRTLMKPPKNKKNRQKKS